MPRQHPALFVALVTAMVAINPVSMDLYLPSMPEMARVFGATPGEVQVTLSVYTLSFAVAQLGYGPLTDRFGRRPVALAGLVIYIAASLACALATSIGMLIALRVAQAFGSCAAGVVARAAVRDTHDLHGSARVFAHMGMAMSMTPLIAPTIGGVLQELFGWRAPFGFMALAGVSLLVLVFLVLTETNASPDRRALRLGRLAANYVYVLTHRQFLGYALSSAFSFASVFVFLSYAPFVLIDLLGVRPGAFGLVFGLVGLGFGTGALLSTRVTPRLGVDRTILIGALGTLAGGVLLNALAFSGVFGVAAIIGPVALSGVAAGLIMPNTQAGAVNPFPHIAGVAAAAGGFLQMGLAAVAGTIAVRLYDGTQLPMTLGMLICPLLMTVAFTGLIWRRRAAAPEAAR